MPTNWAPRRLTDPRDLRAVAHPVRIAILEQLTVRGPLTATELGDLIDESPANCSWHLRKLAEHGFIVEAEATDGRQRPWRAAQTGMQGNDAGPGGHPELAQAGRALTRMLLDREVERLWAAQDRPASPESPWRETGSVNQSMLWLTAEEFDEINAAVQELLLSNVDRYDDPALRPDGARLCAFVAWGIPAGPPESSPVEGDRDA